jgi:hypothetical protein
MRTGALGRGEKGQAGPGRGLRAAGRANFEFKDKVPRSTGCENTHVLVSLFPVACVVDKPATHRAATCG